MYDGMRHDSLTHLMRLADVGLMSFYVQDCKALIEISIILDKSEYVKEIKKREKKYTKSLQSLWDDQLLIQLRDDWQVDGKTWPKGSLLATPFEPFLAEWSHSNPRSDRPVSVTSASSTLMSRA